jgi:hypothetical protein
LALKPKALIRPVGSVVPGEYVKDYPLLTPVAKTLSISPAAVEVANAAPAAGARYWRLALYPAPYVEEYVISAISSVWREATADDWLAATFDRRKLGMAMAAITRMIATTIKSSINENPLAPLSIRSSFERPAT